MFPYTIDLSMLRDIGDADVLDPIRRAGVTFYARGDAGPDAAGEEAV